MIRVTIFIPISRPDHLNRLFVSLELLDCNPSAVTLLTYVDGDQELYETTRRLTLASKFAGKVCERRPVRRVVPNGWKKRRQPTADIKNESKELLPDCDYVMGIEDDTIVPPHALAQLLQGFARYPHAGFIQGVELGRWGVPYVGAWTADDPWEPKSLTTKMPGSGIEEIDAGGFYCYLTPTWLYKAHTYKPYGDNTAGPDVTYGLWLRQQGFRNYIDWGINCEHRTRWNEKPIMMPAVKPAQVQLSLLDGTWRHKSE